MKKFLPKTKSNAQGFTLIELLVVIAIIAVLSVAGFMAYSRVQQSGRDTQRRAEIQSIAQALESNKNPTVSTYIALANSQFQANTVPTDPTTGKSYCIAEAAAGATLAAAPTALWTTSCPTGYATVAVGVPATTAATWRVCASLETIAGAPGVYCTLSSQ